MRSILLLPLPALLLMTILTLAPTSVEAKTFETKNVEEGDYTFEYPNNWKSEKLNRFHSFDARVVLGNNDAQMNFESGSPFEYLIFDLNDTESAVSSLETLAEGLYDGTVEESGADKYTINGHPAPYTIVTYQSEPGFFGATLDMAAQVTLVQLSDDHVALVQFVAEEDDFDKYLPKAEQILESIKPVGGAKTQAGSDKSFTSGGDDLSKTSGICDTVTTQSEKDLCGTLMN